ncbi:MAG: hypothetical protein AUF65_01400 [Chloroflexi bacterium 13_1_20CM_50_12]|nr:MAG: hypothetical protein AUF65_01400 [Chloroflexi bacterium 13_1_20CM_50_12]
MGFFGNPQYHAEANDGWEPFSNAAISGDWDIGSWSNVFVQAHKQGVSVEQDGETVIMSRGKSCGRFLNTQGGVSMAWEFLEGVAWEA